MSHRCCWWQSIPLAKRVTWWPQLMMGFTFGFGAPMGYAAAADRLDAAWAVLYAAAILWDLGFDTIYAHQDREDDALVGVRSTARLFGDRTRPFLAACYAGAVILLALAGWLASLHVWFYPFLLLPAALLARQVITLDIDDPAQCLRLFRANREVGLAVGLAIPGGLALNDPAASSAPTPSWPRAPHVPEIQLHLATEITPIWQATETWLAERNIDPPFWAFAWPGGQALARHILDNPTLAAGKRVLDFAAGGGIAAIACAMAGAAWVEAAEIDRLALAAISLNAESMPCRSRQSTMWSERLPLGPYPVRRRLLRGADDRPYHALADRHGPHRRGLDRRSGPGLPAENRAAAFPSYRIETTRELEDSLSREVTLYRVLAPD